MQTACLNHKTCAGFWIKHDQPNSCVVLPAGYLLISIGCFADPPQAKGSTGLRWSIMNSSSKLSVATAIEAIGMMIDSFPELAEKKGSEYVTLKSAMEKYILPAANDV